MLKLKPGKQASTLSKLAAAVIAAATVGCGSASAQQSPDAPVPSAITANSSPAIRATTSPRRNVAVSAAPTSRSA